MHPREGPPRNGATPGVAATSRAAHTATDGVQGQHLTRDIAPEGDGGHRPSGGLVRSWRARDPASIPHREGHYGGHFWPESVNLTIAAPDTGKSTLAAAEAVALASGLPLLGVQPARRVPTWIFAGQDGADELDRKIAGVVQRFSLNPGDLEGRLFVGDARRTPFSIAEIGPEGAMVNEWVVDATIKYLREARIGVAILDPLRALHGLDENSNAHMSLVLGAFERIAVGANVALELCHHARKVPSGQPIDLGDAAGAGALIAFARSCRVLNPMTEKEARSAGLDGPRGVFRADIPRRSFAPPSEAPTWFRLENETLANGDEVGVATRWYWPEKSR